MIELTEINWSRDRRMLGPDVYVVPLDDPRNRIHTFLTGWKTTVDDPDDTADDVTWMTLGRMFGRALGDISEEVRRKVYAILLHQYAHCSRTESWSDEDRSAALSQFSCEG